MVSRTVSAATKPGAATAPVSRRVVAVKEEYGDGLQEEEEGVEFVWLAQPEAFLGDEAHRVTGLRAQRIHLGVADATGRQQPRPIEGAHFTASIRKHQVRIVVVTHRRDSTRSCALERRRGCRSSEAVHRDDRRIHGCIASPVPRGMTVAANSSRCGAK